MEIPETPLDPPLIVYLIYSLLIELPCKSLRSPHIEQSIVIEHSTEHVHPPLATIATIEEELKWL